MKKKIFKSLSVAFIVFSILFFAFGCIKLARAQEPPKAPTIESGIPGVEVVQPLPINTNEAEYIIFTSLATLGLGIAGFLVSSRIREVSQNNQEEAGLTPITPEQPQQSPHDSYPAAEEPQSLSDNPETEESQNNQEEAGQTLITPEQNRPDNPVTTPEEQSPT